MLVPVPTVQFPRGPDFFGDSVAASLVVPVLVLFNSVKRMSNHLSLEQTSGLPLPPLWIAALLAVFGLWEMLRSLRLPLRA